MAEVKSTEELIHQIKENQSGGLSFLDGADYYCPPTAIYLSELLAERGMEVRSTIQALGLDRSYGYQIFNGTRRPTRNILIRLAFLLGLDLDQTNRLLKIGRKEVLYPRIRRDAAVIFALERKMSLEQLDALLEETDG